MSPVSIGIFVGGAGTRMGGVAKGLLRAPHGDESLVERLVRVCTHAAPGAALYLVGDAAAYVGLGVTALADDPPQSGPMGGLRSLLLRARGDGSALALALACDLPFLSEAVLAALLAPLRGAARVPFDGKQLQPLAAAYAPDATLRAIEQSLTQSKRALMHVLDLLGSDVEQLVLGESANSELRDWDTPEDMQR